MHAKGKCRGIFGTNRDFRWMLLALEPQMIAMLENPSGAPLIASSITEIDEIMIRKLHLVMTTIACGHEIDKSKNSVWPQLSFMWRYIFGTTYFRASMKC
ncbi:hypothetical protein TNCV_3081081 [Trichonephila clavipes]|nr:hypothetical protein TNCV_3081081 [Trichonephila clavipes]